MRTGCASARKNWALNAWSSPGADRPGVRGADEATVDAAELEIKAGHADVAKKLLAGLEAAWSSADRDAPLARRMRALDGRSGAEQKKR